MSEPSLVTCHRDDDNIHVFNFSQNTRAAADQYMQLMYAALEEWILEGHENDPFLLLLDISDSGLFPISHTLSRPIPLLGKYKRIPQRFMVYLTNNKRDLLMLDQIKEGNPAEWEMARRIFPPQDREEARNWLMSKS